MLGQNFWRILRNSKSLESRPSSLKIFESKTDRIASGNLTSRGKSWEDILALKQLELCKPPGDFQAGSLKTDNRTIFRSLFGFLLFKIYDSAVERIPTGRSSLDRRLGIANLDLSFKIPFLFEKNIFYLRKTGGKNIMEASSAANCESPVFQFRCLFRASSSMNLLRLLENL